METFGSPSPSPISLAEVIERVAALEGLPPRRRQELCSAVRRFSRLLGRPPADVPADPAALRKHMASLSAASAALSPGGWRNLKSLVGKALIISGVAALPRRSRQSLPPPWSALLSQVTDRYQRSHLAPFARFCASQGIMPWAVNDAAMAEFGRRLSKHGLTERPKQVHRAACLGWNRAADAVPGWPKTKLSVPDHRQTYALSWSALPDSFRADAEAYLSHFAGDNLFSETARRPLSAATLKSRRFQIRELAAALVGAGHDPQSIRSLRDLVEPVAAGAALNWLWKRNGERATGQLHNFALLLVGIARHWAKLPPAQVEALQALRQRVDPGKSGLTEKNRRRLLQFADPANVALLLQLPRRLLDEVSHHDSGGIAEARMVQMAVAIALELVAPLRIKNLASLSRERHLVRSRTGKRGVVHLVLSEHEVKIRMPLQFELPADVVALLDRYIERYRPRLMTADSDWVFPSREGGHKAPNALATQIARTIARMTGLKMNVHLFRHFAAYIYLKAHPGEYETVRLLLGHRSLATTVAAYCGLEQPDAFRRFDEVLSRYREKGRGEPHAPTG